MFRSETSHLATKEMMLKRRDGREKEMSSACSYSAKHIWKAGVTTRYRWSTVGSEGKRLRAAVGR